MVIIKSEGQMINSYRNKKFVSSMDGLREAEKKEIILEGICIKCDRENNLKIKLGNIIGIIPYDELSNGADHMRISEAWTMVNKPVQFLVERIESGDSYGVVLSRKRAMNIVREEIWGKLKLGDYVSGTIKVIDSEKAMVDIGCGNLAVLSKDDVCDVKLDNILERFHVGEEIEARIKDKDKNNIFISTKEFWEIWDKNIKDIEEGTFVSGVIKNKISNGVLIELNEHVRGIANYYKGTSYGDVVTVYIKKIDPVKKRIKVEIVTDDYEFYKKEKEDFKEKTKDNIIGKKDNSRRWEGSFKGKSPFVIVQGEQREIEHFGNDYVSIYQIIFDVKHNYINEIHYKILEIVNKHRYVTSKQITDIMNYYKFDTTQERIKRAMKICLKKQLLERCFFANNGGCSSYKVYSLGKNGADLLRYRGNKSYWNPLESVEKPDKIKKVLATNQIITAYMKCSHDFKNYYINQIITAKEDDIATVRASAIIYTEQNDYVYEVIRRKENWEKCLCDKLTRYEKVFENIEFTNLEFDKKPKFVICGEDKEQNIEISDLLKGMDFKNLRILYTVDKLNLVENFENSIYEIK
ncbi:replication-relaxation family protein [Clostridium cadaveris]|uniref:replication-relaxation family protein n=1 Tax=Clostridium cadaveris TaxID=1529 RepID=UPI00042411F1|nr:replication-relaxation family protein [Clostridium cadaveris]